MSETFYTKFMQSFNTFYEDWAPFNVLEILSNTIHPEFCMDFDSISESENTEVESEVESEVEEDMDMESESESESESEDTVDSDLETVVPEYNYEENEGSCSESETSNYKRPRIVSIEGNIGGGKSTLIDKLKKKYNGNPKILFLPEPVDIWENFIDNKTGENMIQKFYKNINKYAFSFQIMAFYTRLKLLKDAINNSSPEVEIIVMERSLNADYHVFANMLYEEGCMEDLEFQIYCYISQDGLTDYGVSGIIWLQVEPEECFSRIADRNREGEKGITLSYLYKCEQYHKEWLGADLGFTCMVDGNGSEIDLDIIDNYLF